jgi:hypothetical protein
LETKGIKILQIIKQSRFECWALLKDSW